MTTRRSQIRRKSKSSGKERPDRVISTVLLLIAVIGCIHVVSMLGVELYRNVISRQEIVRLSGDIEALSGELDSLQAIVDHADDGQYREQLARCLGFVRPDETRYMTLAEPGATQNVGVPPCGS